VEPILFVMAILGCGESNAPCRELRLDQARYRSEAQCMAATETVLARVDDIAFPNVVASCRPADARAEMLRGNEILRPPAERPRARIALASAARSFR
jgi:hypothetical protein